MTGTGKTTQHTPGNADAFKVQGEAKQFKSHLTQQQQSIAPGGCVVIKPCCNHPCPPQRPALKVTQGRIWGDPHFIGEDGGKFDVMGEAGKTYNLLSDTGIQVNGLFEQWGNKKGTTVITEMGITTAHGHNIKIEDHGSVSVNGMTVAASHSVTLSDGSVVTNSGSTVQISAGEWDLNVEVKGNHLNVDFRSDDAFSDGVLPDGLWGQTVDFDNHQRSAVDKQGTGAYRDPFATYKSYEVGSKYDGNFALFNTTFPQYNNFSGAGIWYQTPVGVPLAFSGLVPFFLSVPAYIFPPQPYIYHPGPYQPLPVQHYFNKFW